MKKERADSLVVAAGLAKTRSQAKAIIMAGLVVTDGGRVDKAGQMLPVSTRLSLKEQACYVSRGGYKLEGALDDLAFEVLGRRVLDVGASTGGFTDCLLKRGAAHVTAVDVGYGLLDFKLRQDRRVTLLERTNVRYLTPEMVEGDFDLAVIDLSFISLKLVLPPIITLMSLEGSILAMVKPQFEVGREKVGSGGVVRDPRLRLEAVAAVANRAAELGWTEAGRAPSRLKGPKGNQEIFLLLNRAAARTARSDQSPNPGADSEVPA